MKPQLHVQPDLVRLLNSHGLNSFDSIFNLAGGDVISGHDARNVALFELGTCSGYLKREFWVPWKEYGVNWLAGFGWVSKSAREWQILHSLHAMGIAAPEPLAYGECQGQAFLLVRSLADHVPLTDYVARLDADRRYDFALHLGAAIARLHESGFDHPDLYAKHVFVHEATGQVAFLDFQRTRRYEYVPWRRRCYDLAALHASLSETLVSRRERWLCLDGYLDGCQRGREPVLRRQALRAIDRRAGRLLRRRKVSAMRYPPAQPQRETQVEYIRVALEGEGGILIAGTPGDARFASSRTQP